jgi:hypothetical protein
MSTADNTKVIIGKIFDKKRKGGSFFLLVDQEREFDRVLPKKMINLWWEKSLSLKEGIEMQDCIIKYQQIFSEFKLKFND